MKILDILDKHSLMEKFTPQIYAYHATKLKHLKSIIKHGLIPNKMAGGYGSNETGIIGYNMQPLKGIYFSTDSDESLSIGKGLVNTYCIIVAKVMNRTATLDEDYLGDIFHVFLLRKYINALRDKYWSNFDRYEYDHSEEYIQSLDDDDVFYNAAKKYVDDHIDLSKLPVDKKYISNIKNEFIQFIYKLIYGNIADAIGDKHWQASIKEYQTSLTKKLRRIIHKDSPTTTFKIEQPIGFSGSNRIVGIYAFINSHTRIAWGDIGDINEPYDRKVRTPMEIFNYVKEVA